MPVNTDGMPRDDGGMPDGMSGGGGPGGVSASLISYLQAHQGSATYLVATLNSQTAASIILATNQPVMSLGGFTSSDPILTVDQFASLVRSGQVRYVLLGGSPGPGGQSSNSAISQWVQANGTPVSASEIGDSSTSQSQLYDLGSLQGAAA
jgi:4-amino-4-deoxy-L-arabinose transferase-like glycosyltransferase